METEDSLTVISLKGYSCALLPGSKEQRKTEHFYLKRFSNGKEAPISSKIILLIYTLFSYLYQNDDPRNRTQFQINLNKFGEFARIKMDKAQRLSFLVQFQELFEVFGVENQGTTLKKERLFTNLELLPDGVTLYCETTYFSKILNEIFAQVDAKSKEYIWLRWYTPMIRSSILGAKDSNAALAVLLLAVLVAQRGTGGGAVIISLRELVERIPELNSYVWDTSLDVGNRSRKLRRWFNRLVEGLGGNNYFEKYSKLMEHFQSFQLSTLLGRDGNKDNPTVPQLNSSKNKIAIRYEGYQNASLAKLPAENFSFRTSIPLKDYERMSYRNKINSLKYFLKDYLLHLGVEGVADDNFCCVLPNHKDAHPSMHFYSSGNHPWPSVKCFGCGFYGDLLDLIQAVEGVSFEEAHKIAESLFVRDRESEGE